MRIENPYKCDVCGQSKGSANKWLLGFIIAGDDLSLPTDRDPQGLEPPELHGYAIVQWDEDVASYSLNSPHHLCSEQCALKKQSEYLRR